MGALETLVSEAEDPGRLGNELFCSYFCNISFSPSSLSYVVHSLSNTCFCKSVEDWMQLELK